MPAWLISANRSRSSSVQVVAPFVTAATTIELSIGCCWPCWSWHRPWLTSPRGRDDERGDRATAGGEAAHPRTGARRDESGDGGRIHAGPDRWPPDRAARQGRDRRGDGGISRLHAPPYAA